MYKIIFEKFAKTDLADIVTFYLLRGGLELAETNKNRIENQINKLKINPNIYQDNHLEPRLKQLILQKLPYKAYFLVNEQEKSVHIMRILHTSRDHKAIFDEMFLFDD